MKFTLFDADDLKMVEDMFAKAMTRAIVSALKIATREGLLRPEHEPQPEEVTLSEQRPEPRVAEPVAAPQVAEPAPAPVEPPTEEQPRPVPSFLKPPPENPFPPGKAVEPPAPKHHEKTRSIYLKLYRTVADRPHGYVSVPEACKFLAGGEDGTKFSGPISTWLQKGELEAVIVASEKPTEGLPGKLMIKKDSLVSRDQLRRSNKHLPVKHRRPGENVAAQ